MSKKRNKRNTKNSLKYLKAKRAKYAAGGYGYGNQGGSANNGSDDDNGSDDSSTTQRYMGMDGKMYNSIAELTAANAAYYQSQGGSGGSGGSGGGSDYPSYELNYDPPKATVYGTPTDISSYQTSGYGVQTIDKDSLTKAEAGTAAVAEEGTTDTATVTAAKEPEYGVPQGYTLTAPENINYTQEMPDEGKVYAYNKETGARIEIEDPKKAPSYASKDVEDLEATKAAQGDVSKEPTATDAELSERVKTPLRDTKEEKEAMAVKAAERPITRDYAEGVTSDEEYVIQNPDDPEVKTRVAQVITEQEIAELREIAPGREIPVDEIMKRFPDIAKRVAQTGAFASREAQELGRAPTERAAEATYQEMQDVGAGTKEAIDPLGEAGVATREGITGQAVEAPDAARMDTQ